MGVHISSVHQVKYLRSVSLTAWKLYLKRHHHGSQIKCSFRLDVGKQISFYQDNTAEFALGARPLEGRFLNKCLGVGSRESFVVFLFVCFCTEALIASCISPKIADTLCNCLSLQEGSQHIFSNLHSCNMSSPYLLKVYPGLLFTS